MADGSNVVKFLEAGLNVAGLRGRVIANNIANLNAPGYQRGEVRFEELLAKAMAGGRETDLGDLRAEVIRPGTGPLNAQGNDVDLDLEVGQMIKNGAMSRVYLRTLAKIYSQMDLAMRDRT